MTITLSTIPRNVQSRAQNEAEIIEKLLQSRTIDSRSHWMCAEREMHEKELAQYARGSRHSRAAAAAEKRE